jgi:hypothetical protein
MPTKIKTIKENVILDAVFFDTQCAKAIDGILPIETKSNEWSDKSHFDIPVKMPLDKTATTAV